jgi:putative effector of murein hydrolase
LGHAKATTTAIIIGITTKMDGTIALIAMSIAAEGLKGLASEDEG